MTARELIKQLSAIDPNQEVLVASAEEMNVISEIEGLAEVDISMNERPHVQFIILRNGIERQ